jgi:hypothetical protein
VATLGEAVCFFAWVLAVVLWGAVLWVVAFLAIVGVVRVEVADMEGTWWRLVAAEAVIATAETAATATAEKR